MAMKFGLALPYNQIRSVAGWAHQAEAAGWDGCFLGDAIWCEDPMIALAAAATATSRIRLGTMIIPVPLRRPWKLASESLALDRLSDGRLTLGLGAGAVWMGWHAFPDEITDTKTRAGMLDETIDILTLLYQRKQFDYDGQHYHLKLTEMDLMHYPPQPVQQPRIPLWVPGLWPRQKSMQRVLKCDGLLVEKLGEDGRPTAATPDDVRQMKAFVDANRTLTTPFDIVMNGSSKELEPAEQQETLLAWQDAGVTWWIEGLWEATDEVVNEVIRRGPPWRSGEG
ncbi:MAG: LLM class flavin-dependent oxidoreductase [Anaerolineaceae bacterium]|nr:LLM class flavin-dependent oxidoreductase [Anaerolineaceae bacterium]